MINKLLSILEKHTSLTQIRNFLIVGGSVFLIDFVLLGILTEFAGMEYLLASGISFTISTIYNYFASMRFVYKGKEGADKKREFLVFFVLAVIGLGLTQLLMWFFTEKVGFYHMISKVFEKSITMFYSFVSRKVFLEEKVQD